MSDSDEQLEELRRQISYLEQALTAISQGGVDAVMVGGPDEEQIYTLTSADRPYRVIVESMGEGAVTVSESGVVLYANPRAAEILRVPRGDMVGRDLGSFVGPDEQQALSSMLALRSEETRREELTITGAEGVEVPVQVTASDLDIDGVLIHCLVLTDLTMQKRFEQQLAEDAMLGERQRVAREVNDTIVQGLVTAEMHLDHAQTEQAHQAVVSTSQHARTWIGELAGGHVEPGSAVRSAPARSGLDHP